MCDLSDERRVLRRALLGLVGIDLAGGSKRTLSFWRL